MAVWLRRMHCCLCQLFLQAQHGLRTAGCTSGIISPSSPCTSLTTSRTSNMTLTFLKKPGGGRLGSI